MENEFTTVDAKSLGDKVGVNWDLVDLEQFRIGLSVELEHGLQDAETNVTNDDMAVTAKIAWAHLKEMPDYYTRLAKMESEAES